MGETILEGVALRFGPGGKEGYKWASNYRGYLVGLCRQPFCEICDLAKREKLKGFRGGVLEVILVPYRRPTFWREEIFYLGHLIRIPEAEAAKVTGMAARAKTEVTEAVPISEPEGAEIDVACNVVLCVSQGLSLLVDPGAVGFNGKGEEIVRRLVDGRNIEGVWITHGHNDHYVGLPGLGRKRPSIFMTAPTKEIILNRLGSKKVASFHLVRKAKPVIPGQPPILETGSTFRVSTFSLAHSIPGTIGLFVRGSQRKMVYLGDFKFNGFDSQSLVQTVATLKEIAKEGVDILALNIINAHIPGFTPIEALAIETLTNILVRARGRVVVTCFSTNIERIQRLVEISKTLERPVAFLGRGMQCTQQLLGIETEEGAAESEKATIFATGCQAEERSALWRIAYREDPRLELRPSSDILVSAARCIPGNEGEVKQSYVNLRPLVDQLIVSQGTIEQVGLTGLEVKEAPTHFSGHEYQGGLRLALEILRPKQVLVWPQTSPQIEAFREIAEPFGIEILDERNRVIEL